MHWNRCLRAPECCEPWRRTGEDLRWRGILSSDSCHADRLFYNRRVPLPLALAEVEARLSSSYYRQPSAVSQDLRVIYENAASFNGVDSTIAKDAQGHHTPAHLIPAPHAEPAGSPPLDSLLTIAYSCLTHTLWCRADMQERLQNVIEGRPLPAAQAEDRTATHSTRRRPPVGALAEPGAPCVHVGAGHVTSMAAAVP